ncbi:MAG: hypothetical protein JW751_12585 [Polyangiaceae bacterium]|nr:hypothetical protein [Polyangiaceae bacterium]
MLEPLRVQHFPGARYGLRTIALADLAHTHHDRLGETGIATATTLVRRAASSDGGIIVPGQAGDGVASSTGGGTSVGDGTEQTIATLPEMSLPDTCGATEVSQGALDCSMHYLAKSRWRRRIRSNASGRHPAIWAAAAAATASMTWKRPAPST